MSLEILTDKLVQALLLKSPAFTDFKGLAPGWVAPQGHLPLESSEQLVQWQLPPVSTNQPLAALLLAQRVHGRANGNHASTTHGQLLSKGSWSKINCPIEMASVASQRPSLSPKSS